MHNFRSLVQRLYLEHDGRNVGHWREYLTRSNRHNCNAAWMQKRECCLVQLLFPEHHRHSRAIVKAHEQPAIDRMAAMRVMDQLLRLR